MKITPDGTKFLVTESRNEGSKHSKAFVWSCEDPVAASEHLIKEWVQTFIVLFDSVIDTHYSA